MPLMNELNTATESVKNSKYISKRTKSHPITVSPQLLVLMGSKLIFFLLNGPNKGIPAGLNISISRWLNTPTAKPHNTVVAIPGLMVANRMAKMTAHTNGI